MSPRQLDRQANRFGRYVAFAAAVLAILLVAAPAGAADVDSDDVGPSTSFDDPPELPPPQEDCPNPTYQGYCPRPFGECQTQVITVRGFQIEIPFCPV